MKKQIIVFGSLNMDFSIACDELPKQGETISGKEFCANHGGKGANCAIAAAKLGANVAMIGAVGDDHLGGELINALKANNIDTSNVIKAPNLSSGTAVIIRTNSDNRIIINHGANHFIDEKGIFQFSGIIKSKDIFITQAECELNATNLACKLAHEKGAYVIHNPAPARDGMELSNIDLLILNQSESEFFTGINLDEFSEAKLCASADKLIKLGANEIIITLGKLGCFYKNRLGIMKHFSAYKVDSIDSTAAGDTFIGALAAFLASGDDIASAIDNASLAAAMSTLKIGASISAPNYEEFINFKGAL